MSAGRRLWVCVLGCVFVVMGYSQETGAEGGEAWGTLRFGLPGSQAGARFWLEPIPPTEGSPRLLWVSGRSKTFLHAPGRYRLKRWGTRQSVEVRLVGGKSSRVSLSALVVQSPIAAPSTRLFFRHRESGKLGLVVRVGEGTRHYLCLPGTYRVQRDRARKASHSLHLAAGTSTTFVLGAFRFSAPTEVRDFTYFAFGEGSSSQALSARFREGPQVMFPGRYQFQRQLTQMRSEAYAIAPGQLTTAPTSALLLRRGDQALFGRAGAPFFVRHAVHGQMALAAHSYTRPMAELLLGGSYDLLYRPAGPPRPWLARRFVAKVGEVVRLSVFARPKPKPYRVRVTGAQAQALDGAVRLKWAPISDKELRGVRIYRAGGRHPIHGPAPLKGPGYLDLGLSNRKTYRYVLKAVRKDGQEGPPSAVVQSTPQASPAR